MSDVHTLPFPPSVNHYWRQSRGRFHVSAKGMEFRSSVTVIARLKRICTLTGRLCIKIVLHPPNRQSRDIDNYLKALLDAMQHAGFYLDDEQIDRIELARGEVVAGGCCLVAVSEIAPTPKVYSNDRDEAIERIRSLMEQHDIGIHQIV